MTKKNFFDGKPQLTKKFGFEISKSPKKTLFGPKKNFFGQFSLNEILIEFSIFVHF